MGAGAFGRAVLISSLLVLLSGCSIQRWAIDKVGDALAGGGETFASDDDPELIRAAAPFSLKLYESLLAQTPRHRGLLLAAASGFTQYSYAFIQQDADALEDSDFAAARRLHERARHMYLRARDYGLRGLEVAHPGLRAQLATAPADALAVATPADIDLLYWTAVAWAAAIGQAKDDAQLIGDLPIVDALVARAQALDANFDSGALQSFLITYGMGRESDPAQARAHFTRAVELSHGELATPYVALAEAVCVQTRAAAEFDQLLTQALAIDLDRRPAARVENLVMQRRARWLAAHRDELFLDQPTTQISQESPP